MPSEHRKRGPELEAAILKAALNVMQTKGYDHMTMTEIATAAHTNKNAIYRRWENKLTVATEAVKRYFLLHPELVKLDCPDTGNLRDDLLALMRLPIPAIQVIGIHNLKAIALDTLPNVSNVKFDFMNDNYFQRFLNTILQNAANRGELHTDPAKLSPAAKVQPTLLMLSYVISERPYNEAAVESMVDNVLLPVLTH